MTQHVGAHAGHHDPEGHGHHWKDAERVRDFVQRMDQRVSERTPVFELLAALAPHDQTAPIRVLDLGTGYGALLAVVLDAFPNAQGVGLDVSEAMIEVGRQRTDRYGARFRFHLGDLADGTLPSDLEGNFDLIVSSLVVHHLPPEHVRRMYQIVYQRLAPGGAFLNLDHIGPGDDYLQERYLTAQERLEEPGARAGRDCPQNVGSHYRGSVEEHLAWLNEAGFAPVDCFWRRLNQALVGGFKQQ